MLLQVPTDVAFTLKQPHAKSAQTSKQAAPPQNVEVFDIEPTKCQIPAHGFTYVTISFTPQGMQLYTTILEATVEGVLLALGRPKSLNFEVQGEGTLPRVSIVKPQLRNRRGQPMLQFRRLLCGKNEALPFSLVNDGPLPCLVHIDLIDPDAAFSLQPGDSNKSKVVMRTSAGKFFLCLRNFLVD